MAIINKPASLQTNPGLANPLQTNPLNFGVRTFDAEAEGDVEQTEQVAETTETPADEA